MIFALLTNEYLEKYAQMRKSISFIGMNKFQEAIDISNKILESHPEDYSAMYFKAYSLGKMKRYQEQLELSDKLIKKNKNDLFAPQTKSNEKELVIFNIKAEALLKLRRYDDAEKLIDNLLIKDHKYGTTLANKAYLLSKRGNYKEAVDYYEDALEIMDEKIREFEESKKFARIAGLISSDYGLDEVLIGTGKAYKKLKQYEEALDCFDEALNINLDSKEALKAKEEVLKLM